MKGKLTSVKCTTCDRWVSPDAFDMAAQMCVPCAVVAESRLADLKARWGHVMTACKLTVRHYGTLYTPRLLRVQCTPTLDVLTLAMVPGQIPGDYIPHVHRLAKALGVHQVKVLPSKSPDRLRLVLMHADPLGRVVRPLPVPMLPDYTALPMAMTETGQTWALRLFGHQVLTVGATGAGKGSVAWSFLRALAGGIATGEVAVWGMDPKGGMELTVGEPLFARLYADKASEMADGLDELCDVIDARTQKLRKHSRQHVPTPEDPLYALLIDELASLTAYADKATRERVRNTLPTVLTKGRALGVHVHAMVQDGRKEVVPVRNLFTTRIGLRLAEASEVDLVLGDGARDRGAVCDLISDRMPGTGYVLAEGQHTPERVRFSYLTDTDITAMAAAYAYPRSAR